MIGFFGDIVQSCDCAFWLADTWSHICLMQKIWILSFHTPFQRNIRENIALRKQENGLGSQLRGDTGYRRRKESREGYREDAWKNTRGQGSNEQETQSKTRFIFEKIGETEQKGNLGEEPLHFSYSFSSLCTHTPHFASPQRSNLQWQEHAWRRQVDRSWGKSAAYINRLFYVWSASWHGFILWALSLCVCHVSVFIAP